jgi:hypothetical protein
MSRRKKFLVLLLVLVLISQVPFAYRRYRLGRLNSAIQSINADRVLPQDSGAAAVFREYKGVIHVHSFLGGHSTGTFQEIIAGAKANKLDFVIMTEHTESGFDTAALTLSGTHEGVVFVNGNEVETNTGDRLLSIPGDVLLAGEPRSTSEISANSRGRKALTIIAYPEEFTSSAENADGIEVYNVFTNARKINRLVAFFDAIWCHYSYPDLLFANYLQRPDESLRKWDQLLAKEKLVATAGNDSHSNVGLTLNDSSGKLLLGFNLDPYETSFHLVRVHVLASRTSHQLNPLESSELLNALRAGHCFIGFDLLGDTSGFRFEAVNASGTKIQGDEMRLESDTHLKVFSPVSSRVVIMKDGQVATEESGVTSVDWKVNEKGVYRVELYLPQLAEPAGKQPWIISNPIYIR